MGGGVFDFVYMYDLGFWLLVFIFLNSEFISKLKKKKKYSLCSAVLSYQETSHSLDLNSKVRE